MSHLTNILICKLIVLRARWAKTTTMASQKTLAKVIREPIKPDSQKQKFHKSTESSIQVKENSNLITTTLWTRARKNTRILIGTPKLQKDLSRLLNTKRRSRGQPFSLTSRIKRPLGGYYSPTRYSPAIQFTRMCSLNIRMMDWKSRRLKSSEKGKSKLLLNQRWVVWMLWGHLEKFNPSKRLNPSLEQAIKMEIVVKGAYLLHQGKTLAKV